MQSPSSESTFAVPQDIITTSGQGSNLLVRTIHEHFLTSAHIGDLISTISSARDGLSDSLGVAPVFTRVQPQQLSIYAPHHLHHEETRKLQALVFATSSAALVIFLDRTLKGCDASGRVNVKGKKGKDKKRGRTLLNNLLLSQDTPPIMRKFAIDAEAITASLHTSLDLRISQLADALSLSRARRYDTPTRVLTHLQDTLLTQDVNAEVLRDVLADEKPAEQAVMDADMINRAVLRAWLAHSIAAHAGKRNSLDRVRIVDSTVSSKEELDTIARVFNEGQRVASLQVQKEAGGNGLSNAEYLRTSIVGKAMSDPSSLYAIAHFRAIFAVDAGARIDRESFWDDAPALPPSLRYEDISGMNHLQAGIIQRVLGAQNADRIMIVHGPPGTGKTTSIAALCAAAAAAGRSIWVLSQSNAIAWAAASRLLSSGFQGFRLLVGRDSKQYDSIYPELAPYVLGPDERPSRSDVAQLTSDGVRVILCTLGKVIDRGLRHLKEALPIQTVVVDEAGQVDVNELIPLLHEHATTLARLVLFGDEKQLPPWQQGNVPSMRNIFEVAHLRKKVIAMDTQYRMPQIVTDFFSRRIYNGNFSRLERAAGSWRACRLVDAVTVKAVRKNRKNTESEQPLISQEKNAVIIAAQRYSKGGLDFRIIVPHEGVRASLAQRLEEKGLSPSLCVTINDFHGSEADHIIVHLGRSWKVEARDERRAAVMLSRCRVSMLICTSKQYLESEEGEGTLPALLAQDCGARSWISWEDFTEERWPLVQA